MLAMIEVLIVFFGLAGLGIWFVTSQAKEGEKKTETHPADEFLNAGIRAEEDFYYNYIVSDPANETFQGNVFHGSNES